MKNELMFFMPMEPPTTTAQMHKIGIAKNGKPYMYDPPEVNKAKVKLMANLNLHKPDKPFTCGVRLCTKWCFPISGKHYDGEYRITKPDTDNLQKLLKDSMSALKFWKDDALVASEIVEKFWAEVPGIYIAIEEL